MHSIAAGRGRHLVVSSSLIRLFQLAGLTPLQQSKFFFECYYGPLLRLTMFVPQTCRLWAERVDSQTRTRGIPGEDQACQSSVSTDRHFCWRREHNRFFEKKNLLATFHRRDSRYFWIYQEDLLLVWPNQHADNLHGGLIWTYGHCHFGI